MSYAWHLSRGQAGQSDARPTHSAGATESQILGSEAVTTPLTPPNVRNVSPSICLSVVQFRALMQEYRSLDDAVTTRLNRTLANSRSAGFTASPSILSGHVESSSSKDLGQSTYSQAPAQACLAFWRELVDVWIGREEVVQYCLKVEEAGRVRQAAEGQPSFGSRGASEEWLLNSDVERASRQEFSKPPSAKSKAKYDAFDSRASRSEDSADALRRHLKNELTIEAIIRKRSLDVFKSRCRFFTPTFSPGVRGEQERAMWEDRHTRAAEEARR